MSVKIPNKKNNLVEYKEQMKQNRSTLYNYFRECGMHMRYTKISNNKYMIFFPDYKWDDIYLIVDGIRFTDFNSLILFTNELVVRFSAYDSSQVNIPYRLIHKIELATGLDVGYEELHLNK